MLYKVSKLKNCKRCEGEPVEVYALTPEDALITIDPEIKRWYRVTDEKGRSGIYIKTDGLIQRLF
jgi:hypothetical protein